VLGRPVPLSVLVAFAIVAVPLFVETVALLVLAAFALALLFAEALVAALELAFELAFEEVYEIAFVVAAAAVRVGSF
jgi:hypothetical protein